MLVFRLIVLCALGASAAPAAADPAWTRVGQRQVSGSVDRDSIPSQDIARYRQLMICVEEAPIRFVAVTIRYRDGGTQAVGLRALVRAGSCSPDIQLRGRDRSIEALDFTYEAASLGRGQARVDLFAR
jgi:hypothetical protein